MAIRKSSNSGIPFGNTASRPASPADGQPYFNGELQRLELYTGAQYGWQNIVAETPGVTGYTGTVLETNSTNTITISGTNFAYGASVSLVGTDGTEYNATSVTVSNLLSITAAFGALSASLEPYDIKVTNPSNLYGVYYDILTVNDKPVWTTAAGSLGTIYTGQSANIQLASTDEENNSREYVLVSGSFPTGVSLSSSGLISGTASGSTSQTFNFTISVSDGANAAQSRAFSMSYVAVAGLTGGTLSSDSTYYYRTFTGSGTLAVSNIGVATDILVIAGGGGGGSGWYAGGGGAGGVKLYSNLNLAAQNYSVVVGAGGAGTTDARNTSDNGQNSSFATSYTATGGGGGGSRNQRTNGARVGGSGGSGGGAAFPHTLGGLGTSGEGFNGGSNENGYGASGGGAGGVGNSGTGGPYGSDGGIGTDTYSSWLTGISSAMTSVSGWSTATSGGRIAGGGAAGTDDSGNRTGGAGGGGNGARSGAVNATNGITNTGGGGGGGSGTENDSTPNAPQRGATGGSGLVVVRYTRASVGG